MGETGDAAEPGLELSAEDLAARQAAIDAALAVDRKARKQRAPKAPKPVKVKATKPPKTPRQRPRLHMPKVPEIVSVTIAGALSGGAAIAMGAGALAGCTALLGAASCGGSFGLPALILILGICVTLGALILAALRVPDGGTIAFIATGITAIVAAMMPTETMGADWFVIGGPPITAAAYLLVWRAWTVLRSEA